MVKEIPLTQGKIALVDDSDYAWLNQWKWCASCHHRTWYALRKSLVDGSSIYTYMHTLILQTPKGMYSDHKDGNGLHNWRDNLRVCTRAENQHNQQKQKRQCSSNFKGVYFCKDRNKWQVNITVGLRRISLGYFSSEIEAAQTYDEAARKYHGEFAHTNFTEAEQLTVLESLLSQERLPF